MKTATLKKIKSVRRLKLAPGEVLVVSLPFKQGIPAMNAMRDCLLRILPKGTPVLLLRSDIKLSVLSAPELAQMSAQLENAQVTAALAVQRKKRNPGDGQ